MEWIWMWFLVVQSGDICEKWGKIFVRKRLFDGDQFEV